MKDILKLTIGLLIATGLFVTSCVKDDFDQPEIPNPCDIKSGLTPTDSLTVSKLITLYPNFEILDAAGEVRKFPDSLNYVFEGTVISSDEQGSFYKELYLQDSTGGLKLSIDVNNLYTNYKVGQTVHIKLSGLTVHYKTGSNQSSMIEIGFGIYDGSHGKEVGFIPENTLENYVRNQSCIKEIIPLTITLENSSNDYIGRLVKINDVEIIDSEIGEIYALYKKNTNRHIKDCAGHTILLRNSGYSSFQNDTMPQNKGSITAIYTKYGSDYQLLIRDTTDLNFTKERCL